MQIQLLSFEILVRVCVNGFVYHSLITSKSRGECFQAWPLIQNARIYSRMSLQMREIKP